jgi:hypothetical protein
MEKDERIDPSRCVGGIDQVQVVLDEGLKGPFRPLARIFAQQSLITHFGLAFQLSGCRRGNKTEIFFAQLKRAHLNFSVNSNTAALARWIETLRLFQPFAVKLAAGTSRYEWFAPAAGPAIVSGRINFATPDEAKGGEPVNDGTLFRLSDEPKKEWLGRAPAISIIRGSWNYSFGGKHSWPPRIWCRYQSLCTYPLAR